MGQGYEVQSRKVTEMLKKVQGHRKCHKNTNDVSVAALHLVILSADQALNITSAWSADWKNG